MNYRSLSIIGLALFLLAFAQFFTPHNLLFVFLFWNCFIASIALFSEALTLKYSSYSFLTVLWNDKRGLLRFIAVSILSGFLFDVFALWLSKLWVYPFFTPKIYYTILFIPGWTLYWLMILESFLGIKALLEKYFGSKIVNNLKPNHFTGFVGGIALFVLTLFLSNNLIRSKISVFEISQPINYHINFWFIILLFIAFLLIIEYLQNIKEKSSLLSTIFAGHYQNITAILLSSLLLSIVMEAINIPIGYWRYTNWPMSDLAILGLPLLTFAFWPLHYIAFLSLYNWLGKKETKPIWN